MLRFIKKVDVALLAVISIVSIVIASLDYLNVFDNVPFFERLNYTILAIVLLSFIGLHLVLSYITQSEFQERFPRHIDKIIRSLNGVHVEVFNNSIELDYYLAKRIKEAKNEVCDLSWKERISHGYSLKARAKSHKSYEASIGEVCDRITYREIFVFSDARRKDRLEQRLKECKTGYSCRYFTGHLSIPRLQFVLIDGEEVIFASSSYPKLCAIKHAALSEIFQTYYNETWDAATPIKDGAVIHYDEVKRIFT